MALWTSSYRMFFNWALNEREDLNRQEEIMDFSGGAVVRNLPANAGDAGDSGSIPELGGSPGVGNGNPLQYSCLENSIEEPGGL